MKRKKDIISIFSGAMGLDLGLEKAGFVTRVCVETNKTALKTIEANKPKLPLIDRPIQDVDTCEILQKAGLRVGEATIVTGGPCCQSFSTAGKRGSISDARGSLFEDFCRVVKETQPRFFVMENVKGLLSAAIKHRPLKLRGPGNPPLLPEEELGSAFKHILNELKRLNYYVIYGLLNAADYGTPQVRHRVIIIGSRDGEAIELPRPSHSKEGTNGYQSWTTLFSAIKGVKSKEWIDFTEKHLKFLKLLKEGQDWTSLPENLQKEALGAAFDSWGGRRGFYRRLSWKKPSPSLTTSPIGKATMLCHPKELRPLSIEEYSILQEFPQEYTFYGNPKEKYRMIGNAVPMSLGFAIGKMLKETMNLTRKNRGHNGDINKRGIVECGDPELEVRMDKRPKTILNPPRFRKDPSPEAAREWLTKSRNLKS